LDDPAVIEKEVRVGAALSRLRPFQRRRIAWVWADAVITEDQSRYEPF